MNQDLIERAQTRPDLSPAEFLADVAVGVGVGAVGQTIGEHALESAADIIVMGSREHSIWDRIFDPSAGRYVIDNAPCPVLVVR